MSKQEATDKVEKLANAIDMPVSTVKNANIPDVMLSDLYDRVSKGQKNVNITKKVTTGFLSLAFGAAALGAVGAALSEGLEAFLYIGGALEAVTACVIAGGLSAIAGRFFDKRSSIRETVNDLALARLDTLEQKTKSEDAPAPRA